MTPCQTRSVVVGIVLVGALAAAAVGGGHAPREVPPNAVQPAGASFERTMTNRQKARIVRDGLLDTSALILHRPVLAASMVATRVGERVGVNLARLLPASLGVPRHQSPEAGGPCTSARITPLYESGPAYDALLRLIASARVRVDLMIYGWDVDEAGRGVADALIAQARAGVVVRLLVDHGGYIGGENNAAVVKGACTFLDRLRAEPNVRVIEAPDPWFRYDHRKIALIDDRIVWTGGMILTQPALSRWHNFAFLAEGPIVLQYAALFHARWEELEGSPAPPAGTPGEVVPNAVARMVRTDVGERSLKEAVYGAVDTARHHIYLENPYFSDPILVKKLVAARSRGVDVRAVLTRRGDVHTMNAITTLAANRLLRAGARVYLYPAMTHVKALSVDGEMAYIGTGNFDELSLRNNREVALAVRGAELIADLDANLFLRDMAESQELRALLPPPRRALLLQATRLWY